VNVRSFIVSLGRASGLGARCFIKEAVPYPGASASRL
jgi:hypothetical protein